MELMELLTDNITKIKAQLLQMAYGSVRKKTAQTLLQFAEIMNKETDEPLKISRNDLRMLSKGLFIRWGPTFLVEKEPVTISND